MSHPINEPPKAESPSLIPSSSCSSLESAAASSCWELSGIVSVSDNAESYPESPECSESKEGVALELEGMKIAVCGEESRRSAMLVSIVEDESGVE